MIAIYRFRKAGYQAIDRICDYFYSLEEKPVMSQVEPGYLRKALPSKKLYCLLQLTALTHLFKASAPETGEDFQLVADDYQKLIMPGMSGI